MINKKAKQKADNLKRSEKDPKQFIIETANKSTFLDYEISQDAPLYQEFLKTKI